MTIVVGVMGGDGQVVMAADSLVTNGSFKSQHPGKIVRVSTAAGDVLVGAAGDAGIHPLVLKVDVPAPIGDLDRWAQDYAEAWTWQAREAKLVDSDGEVNGEALLAAGGRLWSIFENVALPALETFAVIGSGSAVALGALEVLDRADPERAVVAAVAAVEAACRWSVGCGGPVLVERLDATS